MHNYSNAILFAETNSIEKALFYNYESISSFIVDNHIKILFPVGVILCKSISSI